MASLLNKLTNFLSIKSIVLLGVIIMCLVIFAFGSTMMYLSSTIKYDQRTLKKILQLETQNKEIIHTIKELNYIDSKILLSKDTFEIDSIESSLLENMDEKESINFSRNQKLEDRYNKNIINVIFSTNSQIDIQEEIFNKTRLILFYKEELNDYSSFLNEKINNVIKLSDSISGKISLKSKRINRKIKKKIQNNSSEDETINNVKKLFSLKIEKINTLTKKMDKNILKLSNIITNIQYAEDLDYVHSLERNILVQTITLIDNILNSLIKFNNLDKQKLERIRMNLVEIKELQSFIVNAKKQKLIQIKELKLLRIEKDKINRNLFTTVDTLGEIANAIKIDILNNSDNIARKTSLVVISVGVVLFFLIIFSALTLISRINIPLDYISKFIKKISSREENLLDNIPVQVHDEFGQLSESFNNMTTTIYGNIHKIKDLNKEIEDTQREIIFTMGAIGESRSKETGNHVKRVANYSKLLAKLCGLTEEEAELLKLASPMHDIGKVAIPDSILKKNGKLTNEEFELMKSHAVLGFNMLEHSNRVILKTAAIVAYEHHEKWNGNGYPQGLKGEEIHLYGRITAIADVFDALGSDRCYKKAWDDKRIVNLFKEERGEHFDPNLVDLFLGNFDEFVKIREMYKDAF